MAGRIVKLLVLSFYFTPDLSAGSFRTAALVSALSAAAPDASIEVLTALPNRYATFSVDAPEHEATGNVTVHRFVLPAHRSGMLDQSRAFIAFARQVLRHVRGRPADLVFATSSRLLTAALGALVARRARAPLYLDIRDIFVDTIKDVLPARFARVAKPVFAWLERWTMRRAARINLVSRGFAQYFAERYPHTPLSFHTNGIDDEFIAAAPASPSAPRGGPVEVLYAGNLGEGQGLHAIVPQLAVRLRGRARFRIIGDGGRRAALEQALAAAGADNVRWQAPIGRDALIEAYRAADVLFLHLNDYEAFEKVLPSKLFEYGALGKPVWAGVAGHAAEFVRTEISNSAVFPPCDADQGVQAFECLHLHDTPRPDFITRFARRRIVADMAQEILALARTAGARAGGTAARGAGA
jgi:glycosyltransferase involved in cell wall biosynthesis